MHLQATAAPRAQTRDKSNVYCRKNLDELFMIVHCPLLLRFQTNAKNENVIC